MYLISGRHDGLDLLHHFPHFICQCQLISCLSSGNGKIDGIEPVYPVIGSRFLFGACHPYQSVQGNGIPFRSPDLNFRRKKITFLAIRYPHQPDPFPTAARIIFADTQELLIVTFRNGLLDILHTNVKGRELYIVIFYPPFHGRSPAQFHLVDTVQSRQERLDPVLSVPLDDNRCGRRIQRKGHERTRRLVIGTLGGYDRIADSLGQLRPELPDQGGHLEAGHLDVGMLVQLHPDITASIVGSGIDIPDSRHP